MNFLSSAKPAEKRYEVSPFEVAQNRRANLRGMSGSRISCCTAALAVRLFEAYLRARCAAFVSFVARFEVRHFSNSAVLRPFQKITCSRSPVPLPVFHDYLPA